MPGILKGLETCAAHQPLCQCAILGGVLNATEVEPLIAGFTEPQHELAGGKRKFGRNPKL